MKNRLRFNTARELYDSFPTAAEDIMAAPTDQPCLDFLRALGASKTPEDAVTFCAYMLPRRVAVWWGHQCLTRLPATLARFDPDYLAIAEAWVREPEEDRRYAALDAGMARASSRRRSGSASRRDGAAEASPRAAWRPWCRRPSSPRAR